MKYYYQALFTVVLLMGISSVVQAQQQAMFTQYMFNGLAINPAYAGSHDAISLTGLMREQWTSLPGAPSTQTLAAHSPIRFSRASVGLLLSRDDQDVMQQYGAFASYAYRIPIGKGQLAMGLQGGFTQVRTNLNQLNIITVDNNPDPTFAGNVSTKLLPNVGAGLYFHTKKYYLGLSVPQLIHHSLDNIEKTTASQAEQLRHYFLTGGYVFALNPQLKLKPSFLLKSVPGAPVELDVNTNLLINETLWLGLGYRSFDALNAMAQLQVTPQLSIGYAYDFTVSGLRKVQSGSHEIMLNYTIKLSKESILSPRYF